MLEKKKKTIFVESHLTRQLGKTWPLFDANTSLPPYVFVAQMSKLFPQNTQLHEHNQNYVC